MNHTSTSCVCRGKLTGAEMQALVVLGGLLAAAMYYASFDASLAGDFSVAHSWEWQAIALILFFLATSSALVSVVALAAWLARFIDVRSARKYRIESQAVRIRPWWEKLPR